jgi:hypothetical protein
LSLRRASLFLLLALAAMPAAAEAATKTVTVTADRVISVENDPDNTGNCSTIVFYEWSDVPGTTSATINWLSNGQPKSETRAAPFDDALTREKPPRFAPPGRHRIVAGWSYGSGPTKPNYGCRDRHVPTYEAALSPTGTAVLTIEVDEKKCKELGRKRARNKTSLRRARSYLSKLASDRPKRKAKIRQTKGKIARYEDKIKRLKERIAEQC